MQDVALTTLGAGATMDVVSPRRIALLASLLPAAAFADRIELKDGHLLEGKILNQGGKALYLRTAEGLRRIPAEEVASSRMDVPFPDFPPATPEQGLQDPIARVGPGGLGRKELEFYEKGQGREGALLTALEDELLFQEALKEGLHKDDYVRDRAVKDFRSIYLEGRVSLQAIGEEEISAFLKAHPERFTEPLSLRLKYLQLPRKVDPKDVAKTLKQARANPDAMEGWQDLEPDWVTEEYLQRFFDKKDIATVFRCKAGQIPDPVKNSGGFTDIFRVLERKDPAPPVLEQVRNEVRTAVFEAHCEAQFQALLVELRKRAKGVDDQTLLYGEAMKAGALREVLNKRYLGGCLVEKRSTKDQERRKVQEEILKDLWKRIPVRVLLEE